MEQFETMNEIRNLRAGKHQNFYRVVLETSMKVDTKIELKNLPYRAIIQIPESLWRASNVPRKGNFYPNIPIIYSFKNDETILYQLEKKNVICSYQRIHTYDWKRCGIRGSHS